MAVQLYFVKVASFSEIYGPAPLRLKIVFAVSSLIFAAFISYLNLEITGLYIRRRIAGPFFKANNPYGLKRGFAISLMLRHALMLFSLATVPLLLGLYIPAYFNMDIFARLVETRNGDTGWLFTYENLRALAPILLVSSLAAMVLVFQAVSLLLYRVNVQAPVNALVKRMKAVAAGDFDCKTSVLYNDELGQLKGHFNMMLDGLVERDHIKDTFGRYVSLEIAEKIMKSGKVDLAGEEIQATVLFSDTRGFTPLSEKLPPKELIRFLNDYFAYITVPIAANRGVINKFIGDAVMAIFSPVFGVEDHKAAAVRAALGMREALKEFNALGRYPEVAFGVGVHSGGLVAGNVGTETRLEYTVLGDTVNVASRIESHTRTAGTEILLSDAVMSGLERSRFPGIEFIEGAPVLMKGKSRPMVLYEARAVKA
jgi:class 3 adenylate cyclase